MRSQFLGSVVAALIGGGGLASQAFATAEEVRPRYIGLNASIHASDMNNLEFEDGFGAAVTAGGPLWRSVRGELEVARRQTGITHISIAPVTGEVKATSGLFHLIYDLPIKAGPFRPFIGMGGGVTQIRAFARGAANGHAVYLDADHIRPVWQATAGVTVKVTENYYFDFEGAYFEAQNSVLEGDFFNNHAFEAYYRAYSASVGFRRRF